MTTRSNTAPRQQARRKQALLEVENRLSRYRHHLQTKTHFNGSKVAIDDMDDFVADIESRIDKALYEKETLERRI